MSSSLQIAIAPERGYTLYGDLSGREAAGLASVLVAKGLRVELVEETASLSLALAARGGRDSGPYLRTPEGFVLAESHAILEWIEVTHPEPALVPLSPVRRTVARVLEDWVELWLPNWPRRSWSTLERIGAHLEAAGFLMGPTPVRADWLLAAWLETEVLTHAHAREHLSRHAPRLISLGEDLLGVWDRKNREVVAGDDALPISLLGILEELGADYHQYLALNHQALKDREEEVLIDLGLGKAPLPVEEACELRRIENGRELALLDRKTRRRVAEALEPMRAWHALTLPPAVEALDPGDPRSL